MPALLSIDACIVLCRLNDSHPDPCVWIRDSRAGDENFWHVFSSDDVIALMKDLAQFNFSPDKSEKTIGAVTHMSERIHCVDMKGRTVSSDPHYQLDWEISLGNLWEEGFSFLEVARIIKRQRTRVEPGMMLPVYPNEAWPSHKLIDYFENWRGRSGRPPHMFLPIAISR